MSEDRVDRAVETMVLAGRLAGPDPVSVALLAAHVMSLPGGPLAEGA